MTGRIELGAQGVIISYSAACTILLVAALLIMFIMLRRLQAQRDGLLQEKNVVFGFIHDVGELFSDVESVDVPHLLKRVLQYAMRTTHAGAGALYLVDREGDQLRAQAVSGVYPPLDVPPDDAIHKAFSKTRFVEEKTRSQLIAVGSGLVGRVALDDVPILIPDAERDGRLPHYPYDFLALHSVLLVPMRFHNTVLGVVVVVNKVNGEPFVQNDLNMLQALADQASVSIYYANFGKALDEKHRMDADLNVARHIQNTLLPKTLPVVPGLELDAFSVPAREVGGDYYDILTIDETHVGIAVADVSGKGISAALITTLCRSALQIHAPRSLKPAEVLRAINKMLSVDLAEDFFVTMLYMVCDCATRELTVARAGHVAPIVFHAEGFGKPVAIESQGMAIGIDDGELFDSTLTETTVKLAPGDTVLALSDGVTEAMDSRGNEWGVLNLVKTTQMALIDRDDATEITEQIRHRLLQFVGEAPQYDDMTLVTLRLTTAPSPNGEQLDEEKAKQETRNRTA